MRLHESTALQGFAFDNTNQRLFCAQVQAKGGGNDLCISEVGFDGALLGHMHLPDAGHGVSIGVEPVGSASYVWCEAVSSVPAATGRGTALQRFEFRDGKAPEPQLFLTGSEGITCATDAGSEHLAVRRRGTDGRNFAVFPLAAARAGDFSRPVLQGVALGRAPAAGAPSSPGSNADTFQGYAFQDRYAYLLTGSGHRDPANIDSAISSYDLQTGQVLQDRVLVRVGAELPGREPEGMGVHRAPDGRLSLCFGFAVNESNGKSISIFALDQLVF